MTYKSRDRSLTEVLIAVVFVFFFVGFVSVLCIGNYYRAKRAMERQRQRRLARLAGNAGNGVVGLGNTESPRSTVSGGSSANSYEQRNLIGGSSAISHRQQKDSGMDLLLEHRWKATFTWKRSLLDAWINKLPSSSWSFFGSLSSTRVSKSERSHLLKLPCMMICLVGRVQSVLRCHYFASQVM